MRNLPPVILVRLRIPSVSLSVTKLSLPAPPPALSGRASSRLRAGQVSSSGRSSHPAGHPAQAAPHRDVLPSPLVWAPTHRAGLPPASPSVGMPPALTWVLIPHATPVMWTSPYFALYQATSLPERTPSSFSWALTPRQPAPPQTSKTPFSLRLDSDHSPGASSSFRPLEGHPTCSATYGCWD